MTTSRHVSKSRRGRAARVGCRATVDLLEDRRLLAAFVPEMAVWRPGTNTVIADFTRSGTTPAAWAAPSTFQATDKVFSADFNGDTLTDLAAYRNGQWSIDYSADGSVDKVVTYGSASVLPVVGDVKGTGKAAIGTYNPADGKWSFSTALDGVTDVSTTFAGAAGAVPLLGDFNNDGKADAVLFENGKWRVQYDTSFGAANAPADAEYNFANGSFTPFLCDANGDGMLDMGVFNGGSWFISTDRTPGASIEKHIGQAGDVPIQGYYDTSKSVFVAPGGSDSASGAPGAPVASVSKALSLTSASRPFVRIAAGTYTQAISISGKSGIALVGAGAGATVFAAASANAVDVMLGNDIGIYGITARSASGYGISISGSSVQLRNVSTAGSRSGAVLANRGTVVSSLDACGAHLDGSTFGAGLWVANDANPVTLVNSTVNSNAGGGLLIQGNGAVAIKGSSVSGNTGDGISASNTPLTLTHTTISGNTGRGIAGTGSTAVSGTWLTLKQNGSSGIILAVAGSAVPSLTFTTSESSSNGVNGIYLVGAGINANLQFSTLNSNANDGVLADGGSVVTINGSAINLNDGDGILSHGGNLTLTSTIVVSSGQRGVAISGAAGPVTINNVLVSNSGASNVVAASETAGQITLDVTRGYITNSRGGHGVWLSPRVAASFTLCDISGNGTLASAVAAGNAGLGILATAGSSVALLGSQVNNNGADGILVNDSALSIEATVFRTNQGRGIAIDSSPQPVSIVNILSAGNTGDNLVATAASGSLNLSIERAFFTDSVSGNGIFLDAGASADLSLCGITGNAGIGVAATSGSNLSLLGCTVSGNTGDGIFASGGSVHVESTVVRDGGARGMAFSSVNAVIVNVVAAGNRSHNLAFIDDHGVVGTLSVDRAQFTQSAIGYGMWLANAVTATITNSIFSGNGTDPAGFPGGYDPATGGNGGHGLVVAGTSSATISGSDFSNNEMTGISVIDSGTLLVSSSTISANRHCGILASHTADVTIRGNSISSTGTVRGIATGYNGIEFLHDYSDDARSFRGIALVEYNTIQDNTAWGIFIGSGTQITIRNNQIWHNSAGIGLDGMVTASYSSQSSAVITGNTIGTEPGSISDCGITLWGSGASATIGGAAAGLANTFENFAPYQAIYTNSWAGSPPVEGGDPVLAADSVLTSQNTFVNCAGPVVYHAHGM